MGGQVGNPSVQNRVHTEVDGCVHTPDQDETAELAPSAGPRGDKLVQLRDDRGRRAVRQRRTVLVGLPHHVGRAVLRLVIDTPHVFADDPESDQLDTAEGHHRGEQSGVTGRVGTVQDYGHNGPQRVHQCRKEHPEAGVDGQAERTVVEGQEPVDAVVQQTPASPFRPAGHAFAVAVAEADRVEADPGEDPLREAVALRQGQDALHRPPGQQAEVPRPVEEFHVHAAADDRVVGVAECAADHALPPAVATRDDLVVAVPVQFEHAGDELGRVLEVGVHDHHGVTARHAETGEHRGFLAEVPAERRVMGPFVLRGERIEKQSCAVETAVVHVADLEGLSEAFEDGEQDRVERPDALGLVEAGHDDRQVRAGHTTPPGFDSDRSASPPPPIQGCGASPYAPNARAAVLFRTNGGPTAQRRRAKSVEPRFAGAPPRPHPQGSAPCAYQQVEEVRRADDRSHQTGTELRRGDHRAPCQIREADQ